MDSLSKSTLLTENISHKSQVTGLRAALGCWGSAAAQRASKLLTRTVLSQEHRERKTTAKAGKEQLAKQNGGCGKEGRAKWRRKKGDAFQCALSWHSFA